jgi:hypothetical protein
MSPGATGVPVLQNNLYTIFETAEYVLNIPQLKGHQRAGVTMFAKNHLGSQIPGPGGNADQLHMGLVRPYGVGDTTLRPNYGMYRVQVDMMTHKLLSGKNLLYIMDALWATDYELDKPLKWKMPPFNNTFTSSIFVSFDPVAIESVGYDFLRSEFTDANTQDVSVQMPAVDDYLHQAADSTNWPAGIKYDPNNTGVHVYSLGVHEHWNNATDKQYSRNLGTGNGIELVSPSTTTTSVSVGRIVPTGFDLKQNYPNPFNPTTTITYELSIHAFVSLKIYDALGRDIVTLVNEDQSTGTYKVPFYARNITSGIYFYRLQIRQPSGTFTETKKLVLLK